MTDVTPLAGDPAGSLLEWIEADFGLVVQALREVDHGADAAAQVWQAATTEGLFAVKWSGGGTDAGPMAAAYLAARGVAGVPAPVRTRSGELWSIRDGKRLSVTQWVSGARAAETGLTLEQWTAYGGLLAQVHAVPPAELVPALPLLNPINARMPQLTRDIQHRLSTQAPADSLEADLAKVWQANQDTIDGLLKRSAELEPSAGSKVICHADPHLGNVLVGESQLYLIDWDDVILAPREQDLMFMLGGMGSLGPTTEHQLEAFWNGYGSHELDEAALAYYRCARALEDVALWAEQVLTGPDRAESLEILEGVLSPSGLAVRALF